jgi:hypothetical protein
MGVALIALAVLGATAAPGAAATTGSAEPAEKVTGVLAAKPAQIDFKKKHLGTDYYKQTTITNTSGTTVRLVVTAGLPDDFGFGLQPGETCPELGPGEPFPAGATCDAVVRFTPTAGFVGWQATGSLTAIATDIETGAIVTELTIPVLGLAVA